MSVSVVSGVSKNAALILLIIWATYGTAHAATHTVTAPVDVAQQRQATAEHAYTQSQQQILAERVQLTQALHTAHSALAVQRQQTAQVTHAKQRLEALRQQALLSQEHQQRAYRVRIERAAAALKIASPGRQPPQDIAPVLAAAVQDMLRVLSARSQLTISDTRIAQRDGQSTTVQLIRVGAVQLLASGADAENSGLVISSDASAAMPAAETLLVNGAYFNHEQRQQLHAFATAGQGMLAVDITGSIQQQQTSTNSVWTLLAKGGIFVWPICALGLIAVCLAIERMVVLRSVRIDPRICDRCIDTLHGAQQDQMHQTAAVLAAYDGPLQRVLTQIIEQRHLSSAQRESHIEAALLAEEPLLERNRSLLAVLAAVAPLLGLLGTVTGMIATFHNMSVYGTANPALLSDGISEALITTQLGLIVAVPILLFHALVSRMIESRQTILEYSALRVDAALQDVVSDHVESPHAESRGELENA